MGIVAVVIGIPVTLVLRGGGEPDAANGLELTERVRDQALGVRLSTPERWTQRKRGGVLRLRSPDRSAGITITAPGPARDAGEIFETARSVIREQYRSARVRSRFRARIGGRPAQVAVFTAIDREHGTPLVVDAMVVRGPRRAYLIQTFTDVRAGIAARSAGEAVLRSLRFIQ